MDVDKIRSTERACATLAPEKLLLDRFIYKFKNRFAKEKPYHAMRQTRRRLDIAMKRVESGEFKSGKEEELEVVKRLFENVKVYAMLASHHSKRRIEIGNHWTDWAMNFAVCSRVWCLADFVVRLLSPGEEKNEVLVSAACHQEPVEKRARRRLASSTKGLIEEFDAENAEESYSHRRKSRLNVKAPDFLKPVESYIQKSPPRPRERKPYAPKGLRRYFDPVPEPEKRPCLW